MKKTISIVLVLALGLASVSLAEEGIWTTKANMPTGRWELSTCVVDGKIYAIGGGSFYQPLRAVEVYDPATDTWTTKSDMPTARTGLSASVVNGKIYVIGGGDLALYPTVKTFSTVEEYDPATDTWTRKADMPTARGWHSASVLDGRIYVIGGSSAAPSGGTAILTVEVYDPATDSWIQKGNIPERMGACFTSAVDGKIYAFGGYWGLDKVREYDPVTDTWIQKADMPTRRCGHSTSVVDGNIYAVGGHPGSSPYPGLAAVEIYDPATDTWTAAPDMPTGRCGVRTSVVDGKIYAIGGYTGTWLSAMCVTVEEYEPPLVVDFNGDGKVDFEDFSMLAQYRCRDDSPFVDHRLDCEDLAGLAEYWLTYPGVVAYWELDETEGIVAHDSVGDNDAYIAGALWQPAGGKVGGALQFDGVDDLGVTNFVLNPADASFSIFVWVKGLAPGQVIISQTGGANWLLADVSEGNLMTELQGTGRFDGPLSSQTVIIDGDWHRVGLTWDKPNRILYVDDAEVAKDTQTGLAASTGGLYFGAGKNLVPASFFSGLIDDVRIYDRAIVP